jgi:predicted signal transduction protein with EAL and GGDEF domain
MTWPQPLSRRLSLVQGISNRHLRRNQERMLETLLGHNLGLRVVVEGVESSEQYHLLHDIGCNEVPGLDLLLITINRLWLLDSR